MFYTMIIQDKKQPPNTPSSEQSNTKRKDLDDDLSYERIREGMKRRTADKAWEFIFSDIFSEKSDPVRVRQCIADIKSTELGTPMNFYLFEGRFFQAQKRIISYVEEMILEVNRELRIKTGMYKDPAYKELVEPKQACKNSNKKKRKRGGLQPNVLNIQPTEQQIKGQFSWHSERSVGLTQKFLVGFRRLSKVFASLWQKTSSRQKYADDKSHRDSTKFRCCHVFTMYKYIIEGFFKDKVQDDEFTKKIIFDVIMFTEQNPCIFCRSETAANNYFLTEREIQNIQFGWPCNWTSKKSRSQILKQKIAENGWKIDTSVISFIGHRKQEREVTTLTRQKPHYHFNSNLLVHQSPTQPQTPKKQYISKEIFRSQIQQIAKKQTPKKEAAKQTPKKEDIKQTPKKATEQTAKQTPRKETTKKQKADQYDELALFIDSVKIKEQNRKPCNVHSEWLEKIEREVELEIKGWKKARKSKHK